MTSIITVTEINRCNVHISTPIVKVNLKKKNKRTIHGHLSCKTKLGIAAVYTDMMIRWLPARGKHISSQKQYSMFLLHTEDCH